PRVLFLDEPNLGLDAQTRRAIWEYIKKMNKEEKTTIFLTTHYMDEADFLCNRVAIMDHGKIVVVNTIPKLKNAIGNDVITLSCSDLSKLKKAMEKEEWIKNIKQHENTLTLGVERGEEKIPLIVETAQKLNTRIKSISVRKPTLDDVFLHFTGRRIRDNEGTQNPLRETPRFHRRRM
ncbi:MAG TPA: DUF4162 domain-containing protein, partial [Thermoplasmatales archaeon]|nr:DUF4162 domain-containing protein [Thermoplasmatales archaeon]